MATTRTQLKLAASQLDATLCRNMQLVLSLILSWMGGVRPDSYLIVLDSRCNEEYRWSDTVLLPSNTN